MSLVLLLITATVVLAPLAERITMPYPVVLLAFGLVVSVLPGVRAPSVDPEWILPVVLPPLLFAAARRTSWRQFLDNRRAIGLLAVALVVVTAFAVGAVASASCRPPARRGGGARRCRRTAGSCGRHCGGSQARLPRRLRTILEGEGLSNDATSLVLYEVAVAATLTGSLSVWGAAGTLALAVAIGIAVGLAVAVLTRWLLNVLPAHPAGSALILVVPFAAYGGAEVVHGSGVLAVVCVALALSRSGDVESAQTRLVAGTTWEIVELLMTGAAFAFVGVELRTLASSVPGPLGTAIWQALIVTAVVVAVRFLWIFPVTTADERLRRRGGDTAEPVGWQQMTVASWAGMRGVVTLAAVLALPMGFPERERLIFIAFVVIISTMLLQGLTLPALVKRLDVVASVDERDVAAQDLLRSCPRSRASATAGVAAAR